MCGIVGIVGQVRNEDINWTKDALISMKHRGPDASSSWIARSGNAILGHRRLSIIDTSKSNDQPLISDDEEIIMIFNGEIYNYIELRDKLVSLGEVFKTKGDTEVLLASYKRWGVKCLEYLNGMFSFAIWDQRRGAGNERLFFARDRSGEKPFYYRFSEGRLEFASELKGIHQKEGLNLEALNYYLALGFVPGDLCITKGIKKLPPAHCGLMDMRNGELSIWQYWKLPELSSQIGHEIDGEELADEAWSLLLDSVRIRLRSDVPTGVFLSGGLDSSLVTAAASQVSELPIKTFTIGIPGSAMDETDHAQLIADAFSTEHHKLQIEKPSLELLDDLSSFVDEPIADSSILPSFMVSRLTSEHVKVALGGDGGDELFGGYQHYQNILRYYFFMNWMPKTFLKHFSSSVAKMPAGISGRNMIASLKDGPLLSGIWGTPYFDLELRSKVFNSEVKEYLGKNLASPEQRSIKILGDSNDVIDSLTRLDFKQLLPDDYLVKVDRASMANSLEVRTPFLDHKLIEFAFKKIPSRWKCTLKERRRIQHLMARKNLPDKFILNRKQGFSVPMDSWIKNISIDELIHSLPENVFNVNFIKELFIGQKRGRTNGARLFALMMLGISNTNLNLDK